MEELALYVIIVQSANVASNNCSKDKRQNSKFLNEAKEVPSQVYFKDTSFEFPEHTWSCATTLIHN